jgi:hypothetical protein
MCSLSSSTGPRVNILKIKQKPKLLQDWQAYQALTYENQWKPYVDEEWEKYKREWASEHPNKNPPKKRFTIMVEVMKEKFKHESEEMKQRCEDYRKSRKLESPVPNDSIAAGNLAFQS